MLSQKTELHQKEAAKNIKFMIMKKCPLHILHVKTNPLPPSQLDFNLFNTVK
jgi:hypothetical protein